MKLLFKIFHKTLVLIAPLLIANKCPPPSTNLTSIKRLTTSPTTGNFTIPSSGTVNRFINNSLRSPSACGYQVSTNDVAAGSIRGEAQIRFNACDPSGGITARYYENARCGSVRKISKTFNGFLRRNLKACVEQGTRKRVQHVNIIDAGISGDPRHTSRSLHSMNRAIDIKSFEITYTDGSTETINSDQQSQRASFFQGFAQCWSNAVIAQTSGSCPGSIPKGFIGREDPDHRHHIHISLPYCPRDPETGVK